MLLLSSAAAAASAALIAALSKRNALSKIARCPSIAATMARAASVDDAIEDWDPKVSDSQEASQEVDLSRAK